MSRKISLHVSERTYLIADRIYSIDLCEIIADLPMLEPICIRFFDDLPTVTCRVRRPRNPVLPVERGDGGRVVVVERRVLLRSQRTNLLGYLWIDRLFLLGKGRPSKADCQSYKGKLEADFHCLLWGFRTVVAYRSDG